MIAYLTSTLGGYYKKGGKRIPTQLNTENGLSTSLQKHWKDNAKVLIMSSDADDVEKNDGILYVLSAAFPMSGLSVRQMRICDNRNAELVEDIAGYDAVILAGGHVPTQNRFFERIRLKEHLYDFDGIFIGISAGTMNSAEVVYAQPELEGENIDPEYQRSLPSLRRFAGNDTAFLWGNHTRKGLEAMPPGPQFVKEALRRSFTPAGAKQNEIVFPAACTRKNSLRRAP